MIILNTGTPGSGKTYDAVTVIVLNLKKGRKVYTNIDGMENERCQMYLRNLCGLTQEEFENQFFIIQDKSKLYEFWKYCDKGSLIVFDEIQKFFRSIDRSKESVERQIAFSSWAETHRHDGYDLIMITQRANNLTPGVRELAEWNYAFRKVNFFGSLFQSGYLCYAYAGDSTSGAPLSKSPRKYNPKIFPCYKSYVTDDTKEQNFKNHVNVLRHPVFFILPVVLCATIYMFFFKSSFASGDIFGKNKYKEVTRKSLEVSEASASVIPAEIEQPIESVVVQSAPTTPGVSSTPPIDEKSGVVSLESPGLYSEQRLNWVQYYKSGKPVFRIVYDGRVYYLDDFPYDISFKHGEPYAMLPVESDHTDESK